MIEHVDTPESRCRFAVMQTDITPPAGIYHRMWGAARHDRASGVHRPLRASVMVFRAAAAEPSPATEQVVLALDHCLFWSRDVERLLDAVESLAVVPRECLLVVFSHTHAAGLMDSKRGDLPGGELIPGYLDRLGETLADLVLEARAHTVETVLSYAEGRCDLAANRDFHDDRSGQFVCGYNPQGEADDRVVVVRASDSGGRLLATVVNYACHPTTLAWDNTLISPDYPGAARELVEEVTGAPCIFIQGAAGDLGPKEGYVGDVTVADRNGRRLGYAALSALESLAAPGRRFVYAGPVVSGATLGTWKHVEPPAGRLEETTAWRLDRVALPLEYKADLPPVDVVRRDLDRSLSSENEARAAGDDDGTRRWRALAERCRREIARLEELPGGDVFPYRAVLWRLGDAVWAAVEGEPYQLLQRDLRRRFPGVPIVLGGLAYGSRCSYLPPADLYGKGLYQESIAVLAPGSLERLIDGLAKRIARLTA